MNKEIQLTNEIMNNINLSLIIENTRLKKENVELLEKLHNLYNQDEMIIQYKKHIETLEDENKLLKEENKRLNNKIKELENKCEQLENKCEQLENKCEQLEKNNIKLEKKINKLYISREKKGMKIVIQDINNYLQLENSIPELYDLRMERNYESHYIENKHIKKVYGNKYDLDDIKNCYCYYAINVLNNLDDEIKDEMNDMYPNMIDNIIKELKKLSINKTIYNTIYKNIKNEADELFD